MGLEFNRETIESKFVKYLLEQTPLPIYPFIETGKYMIKGCKYIFRNRILKCTKEGIFTGEYNYKYEQDKLMSTHNNLLIRHSTTPYVKTLFELPDESNEKIDNLDNSDKKMYVEFTYEGWLIRRVLSLPEYESFKVFAQNEDSVNVLTTREILYKPGMNINGQKEPEYNNYLSVTNNDSVVDALKYRDISKSWHHDSELTTKSPMGTFEVIGEFLQDTFMPGVTQTYISRSEFYDSDLHRYLGDYLRYIRNQQGIDLMPLYNCYCGKWTDKFTLEDRPFPVSSIDNKTKKYYLVPIKFNTDYTVFIDGADDILVKGIIYDGELVKDSLTGSSLSNLLPDKLKRYKNASFKRPFVIRVSNMENDYWDKYYKFKYIGPNGKAEDTFTKDTQRLEPVLIDEDVPFGEKEYAKKMQANERFLYLAIEVPKSHVGTLTVLEGNYKRMSNRVVSDISVTKSFDRQRLTEAFVSKLYLANRSDFQQHPVSPKLIEYLLGNTIDSREQISENIINLNRRLHVAGDENVAWNDGLRYKIYNTYMNFCREEDRKEDILGYVDSDFEDFILRGGRTVHV